MSSLLQLAEQAMWGAFAQTHSPAAMQLCFLSFPGVLAQHYLMLRCFSCSDAPAISCLTEPLQGHCAAPVELLSA